MTRKQQNLANDIARQVSKLADGRDISSTTHFTDFENEVFHWQMTYGISEDDASKMEEAFQAILYVIRNAQ